MSIVELTKRVQELETRQNNIVRLGQVGRFYPDETKIDVVVGSRTIKGIPYLTQRAAGDSVYWAPEPGELGLVFSPSGVDANSVFLPGIFYDGYPAPESDSQIVKRTFSDGSSETLDKSNGELVIDASGKINLSGTKEAKIEAGAGVITCKPTEISIQGTTVKITATNVDVAGNVNIKGLVTVTGTMNVIGIIQWNGLPATIW